MTAAATALVRGAAVPTDLHSNIGLCRNERTAMALVTVMTATSTGPVDTMATTITTTGMATGTVTAAVATVTGTPMPATPASGA